MHIAQFRVENFRRFEDVTFELNPDLNVLTGVNNSGKTSVLEAVALWAECFEKLLRPLGKANTALRLRRGDHWFESAYLQHDDFFSIRSSHYGDIFRDSDKPVRLTPTLDAEGTPLAIGFEVRQARGALYEVKPMAPAGIAAAFQSAFTALPSAVETVFASPIAAIRAREEFLTRPSLRRRVLQRDSMQVIRNRLYLLKANAPTRFEQLLDDASYVLLNGADRVEIAFRGDIARDVEITTEFRASPREPLRDLSLLGSGTLQVLELLLGLYTERRDLTLVLLDEPDSHLHRDLQRRLIELLRRRARDEREPCQTLVTTHNEGLIRSTPATHLFHLEEDAARTYRALVHGPTERRRRGLQPSRHAKVLQSLGGENALDLLNALEADRLVLVEGEDDARYIQAIMDRTVARPPFAAMYWAYGGVDALLQRLEHDREGLFEAVHNGRSLWSKAALVFDMDHATDEERRRLREALAERRGYTTLPVVIWPAYTIEATVLIDRAKLTPLVEALLRAQGGEAAAERIADAVRDAHESLRQRLVDELGARTLMAAIEGARVQRMQSLRALLPGRVLSPMVSDYFAFARQQLEAGRVDHLARKADVAAFFVDALQRLGVETDADGLFERIVAVTTPATRPACWDDLAAAIR